MTKDNVVNIRQAKAQQSYKYRDHVIRLTYRPGTNDWQYTFKHVSELNITGASPRLEEALDRAKKEIDILSGDRAKRKPRK